MWNLLSFSYALCVGALVAADFTQPDSSLADFVQQGHIGDTIDIAWNAGWNWGKGAQPNVADLFIMWSDRPTAFSQLVHANVNLSTSGSYSWIVDVPNDKIAATPKFVFRFSQHTEEGVFDIDLPRMPSRAFLLVQKASTSSPSTSSSLSITTKATVSSEASQTTPVSRSNPDQSNNAEPSGIAAAEKKTSTAAIAAGVLGSLVGIALVLGGVLLLLRQARKRREAKSAERRAELEGIKGQDVYSYYYAQELPGAPPSELPGDRHGQSRELDGSTPRDWH